MTELRPGAKKLAARHFVPVARRLRRRGWDRVKGEEKCQDAARLSLRSAWAMCTRSIHKPLKEQD
jgi:hypothetical protein